MAIDVIVVADETNVVRYTDATGLQSPDSGALVLLRASGTPLAAYAPGTWFMAEEVGSGKSSH